MAHLQEAHVMQGALLQEAVHQLNGTAVVEERQLNVVQLPARIGAQTHEHALAATRPQTVGSTTASSGLCTDTRV